MIRGIDISHNNGLVNIAGLPADISFVCVKASQGAAEQDPYFQQFYHELKTERPEIMRIPYHFFDPRVDGVLQAQNVLSRGVNYTEPGTGPLMIDVEGDDGGPVDNWVAQNLPLCIQRINDFIAYVQANCGRQEVLFYSFDHFINVNLGGHTFPNTIFWVSSFQNAPPPFLPGWPYKFWQYSQYGQLDGTTSGGNFDLDQFMGTQDELNALANR